MTYSVQSSGTLRLDHSQTGLPFPKTLSLREQQCYPVIISH